VAEAYRVAMKGVLTSRHFIYLVEGDPEVRERLTDWELASRLVVFPLEFDARRRLVRRSPKRGLDGRRPGRREVDRLLTDEQIDRFIEDFSRQWLQLHRLGMFSAGQALYPKYDAWLETSLRDEPIEFFREMFAQNLPIDEFIDSDWTMANARISDFYGFRNRKAAGFERVSLKPEDIAAVC
jgi:hypothetical protein